MNSLQVGGPADENALLSTPAGADISMQAHDREWTTLEGHTRAVTSLAYTIDGMYMLSGASNALFSHCSCLHGDRSSPPLFYQIHGSVTIQNAIQCQYTLCEGCALQHHNCLQKREILVGWCLQSKAVRFSFLR